LDDDVRVGKDPTVDLMDVISRSSGSSESNVDIGSSESRNQIDSYGQESSGWSVGVSVNSDLESLSFSVIFNPGIVDVSVVHSVGIVGVLDRVDVSVEINSDVISADFSVVESIEFNSERVLDSEISHTSSNTSNVVGNGVDNKYKSISSLSIFITNSSRVWHAERKDGRERGLESVGSSQGERFFKEDRTSLSSIRRSESKSLVSVNIDGSSLAIELELVDISSVKSRVRFSNCGSKYGSR